MRLDEAAKLLCGSMAVYAIMAACSATSGSSGTATAAGDPTQGGSRLKVNYYAGADGSKQATGTMHDSQRNEDCSFTTAADGVFRCLPTNAANNAGTIRLGGPIWADSSCTTPLVQVLKGCAAPPYGVATDAPTCGPAKTHVYAIGSRFTGTTSYEGTPGNCGGNPALSSLEFTYDYYAVGAEVPASSFVQATVQTE
jgi:hypothetical protein